jgi:hypothetical protein
MNNQELREIDIKIAKAVGFFVKKGTLYAPSGTLLGGDIEIHWGSKEMTPEIEAGIWQSYTPRFSTRMDEAMFLLDLLREQHFVSYNLFLENDMVHHSAEIGHWGEPDHPNYTFSGCEKTPALAVCQAVLKFLDDLEKQWKGVEDANPQ